ncbi:MAG TPA: hypothetical protein VL333_13155 [Candidatus Saccharimonadales bacterium]|nr:hypothetical protein [Candidatus Saccharimonadales bacterium]
MPASQHIKPISRDPRAKRVADYVNTKFDGNLSRAADEIGCNYDHLSKAANGQLKKGPSVVLLNQLAQHSGLTLDWWINGDLK